MRVIARKALVDFWNIHPRAESQLRSWYAEVVDASWSSPQDVKLQYGNASVLKDGRIVFNICGNEYRLVVWVNYEFFTVYVRFVGTHADYDKIDAQTI